MGQQIRDASPALTGKAKSSQPLILIPFACQIAMRASIWPVLSGWSGLVRSNCVKYILPDQFIPPVVVLGRLGSMDSFVP